MQTAALVQFVIIRAGDGIHQGQLDPRFAEYWAGAKQVNLPRGSYWFFRPELNAQTQADSLLRALEDDHGELPAFLDLESNTRRLAPSTVTRAVVQFLNAADPHLPYLVGFYTSRGFWNANIIPSQIPNLAERTLWVAQWPTGAPTEPTAIPAGWPRWDFWQFSSTGNGSAFGVSSRSVDLNVWRSTWEEFAATFDLTAPPPEPVIPRGIQVISNMNVRSGPTISAAVVATLLPGSRWPLLELARDERGRLWGKIAEFEGSQAWVATWVGQLIY
jgi:GH25 family lysozyme M1 (1,4-beta-N-acetylmuramidase)